MKQQQVRKQRSTVQLNGRLITRSFVFVLIVVLFSFCEKTVPREDKPCNPETVHLSADLAKACYQAGTYWVFIDSISSQTDSLVVQEAFQSSHVSPTECGGHSTDCFIFRTLEYPYMKKDSVELIHNSWYRYSDYATPPFYVSFSSNISDSSSTYNRKSYDSLFVFDRYYRNVEVTKIVADPGASNNSVRYYINSDYGYLKKEIYNSTGTLIARKILMRKNIVR